MENKFEITKEIMANANTYMSIALKEVIASGKARECVRETYSIHAIGAAEAHDGVYGLPPVYCEDTGVKARIMMTCLMAYYLKVWDDSKPLTCDIEDYDEWAGAHVLNQIERFKSGEFREKAFDILADYRELERYMNSAIYSVLRELNDPAMRILSAIGEMGSVEAFRSTLDVLEATKEGIEKEKERQERIINGEEDTEGGEENGGGE